MIWILKNRSCVLSVDQGQPICVWLGYIGISVDNIKDQKDSDLFLEYSDKPILDAPEYKERMFLKVKKNRDSLKLSSQKKHFQIFVLLNLTKTQEC